MTLDEIGKRLDADEKLNKNEQQELWDAIQKLDQPMKACLISDFIRNYPDF